MPQQPPHYPLRFYALLLLGAVGLALVAGGVTGATGWGLSGSGLGAGVVSLPGLCVIHGAHQGRHEFRAAAERELRP